MGRPFHYFSLCVDLEARSIPDDVGELVGVLSVIIAAETVDRAAIGLDPYPPDRWPSIEVSGIDPIKLSTLHYLASGRTPGRIKTLLCVMRFRYVGGDKKEGPWLLGIPKSVCKSFASMDPLHAHALAVKWGDTDELQAHDWSMEDAQNFIIELSSFARESMQHKSRLFLWLCP